MNPAWVVRTGRLVLAPVGWTDLPDLIALKGDASVYAQMLGGVCGPARVRDELAAEQAFWAARGVGMWAVREAEGAALVGLTGLHERPDGLGVALRFAFRPEKRGRGLAREAAGAALRFAHDRAGLARVVAVTRETNLSARTVVGAIGMRWYAEFMRGGERMLVFESVAGRTILSPLAAASRPAARPPGSRCAR